MLNLKHSLTLLLFLTITIVSSQQINWHKTNPGGGGAFSTVGASASGIIVAGSDLSGAYISQDDGKSWFVLGASQGMIATHVSGMGFHPTKQTVHMKLRDSGASYERRVDRRPVDAALE